MATCPLVQAPLYSTLPEPPLGQHRFVAARNGVMLEARNRALHFTTGLYPAMPAVPAGDAVEHVTLAAGPIPRALLDKAFRRSRETAPKEWAGLIVMNGSGDGYELIEPVVESAGAGYVRWQTDAIPDDRLVLDIHSHGDGPPYHSPTDDESDRRGGVFLSVVIGRSRADTPQFVFRYVAHGVFAQPAAATDLLHPEIVAPHP